jgi:hypothetical protein
MDEDSSVREGVDKFFDDHPEVDQARVDDEGFVTVYRSGKQIKCQGNGNMMELQNDIYELEIFLEAHKPRIISRVWRVRAKRRRRKG